jgi:uncharacterized MAPEG superfamily protein
MGMNFELDVLIAAALWGLVQLVAAGQAAMLQYGATWAFSARDAETPPLNPIPARFDRNFRNYMESFSFFVVAILAAELAGVHNALTRWGAITYLAARFVYTALYVSGIPFARSVAWNIAAAGMLAVLVAPFVSR